MLWRTGSALEVLPSHCNGQGCLGEMNGKVVLGLPIHYFK